MPSSRRKKRNRKEGNPRDWRNDLNRMKERFEYGEEKRKENQKGKSKKARNS